MLGAADFTDGRILSVGVPTGFRHLISLAVLPPPDVESAGDVAIFLKRGVVVIVDRSERQQGDFELFADAPQSPLHCGFALIQVLECVSIAAFEGGG